MIIVAFSRDTLLWFVRVLRARIVRLENDGSIWRAEVELLR